MYDVSPIDCHIFNKDIESRIYTCHVWCRDKLYGKNFEFFFDKINNTQKIYTN